MRTISRAIIPVSLGLLLASACGDSDDGLNGGNGGNGGNGAVDPSITAFTADDPTVTSGEATDLVYAVADAQRVTISTAGGDLLLDATAPTGSVSTGPLTETTAFTLRAEGAEGTTPAEATLTVTVEALEAPSVSSFAADPATVAPGGTSELSWTTENAESVAIVEEGGATIVDDGAPDGTTQVQPTQTTTYRLTATGPGGTADATVLVTVDTAPRVVSFTATENPIDLGQSTFLNWTVENADTVTITTDDTTITSSTDLVGTVEVTPDATTTYTLTAAAAGEDDATSTLTLTVNAPNLPVIVAFAPDQSPIGLGESAVLSWEVTGADTITVGVQGEAPTVTDADAIGTLEVSPLTSTVYELVATNIAGENRATTTVEVTASAPLILDFAVSADVVGAGDDVVVSWETLGADTVVVTRNGAPIASTGDGPGTVTATASAGDNAFVLTATNGTGSNQQTLTVVGQDLPTIVSFTADTGLIYESTPVVLSWSVLGTVDLELLADGAPVPGFPGLSGPSPTVVDDSGTFTATVAATTTFTLRAGTAAGTVDSELTVELRSPFSATPGASQSYPNEALAAGETAVFRVETTQTVYLEARTLTALSPEACTADTVLTLRDDTGAVVGTDDDDGLDLCSAITREDGFARIDSGTYDVEVTEASGAAIASYALLLDAIAVDVCGNGVVDGTGETCDDGNTANGDGCSSTCASEDFDAQPGSTLTRSGLSIPAGGVSTTAITVTSTVYLFAETFSDAATEACSGIDTTMTLNDDTGAEVGFDDDGGVSLCSRFDPLTDAFARLGPGDYELIVEEFGGGSINSFDLVLSAVDVDTCANGIREADVSEQCDDGNSTLGDGCDDLCEFEGGTPTSVPTLSPVTLSGSIGSLGEFDAYELTVTQEATLTLETFALASTSSCASLDTRMFLVDDAGDVLGSDDSDGVNSCSRIDAGDTFAQVAAGTYYVLVREDGDDATIGAYDLVIEGVAAGCGDGVVQSPELCDDGNTSNADFCSNTCEPTLSFDAQAGTSTTISSVFIDVGETVPLGITVPSSVLVSVETFSDASTLTCSGIDTVMRILDASYTQIGSDDDGGVSTCSLFDPATDSFMNLAPGDYVVEVYEFGQNSAITIDVIMEATAPACGDGSLAGGEQCDDGNTSTGDGCDDVCQFETSGTFTASAMASTTYTSQSIGVGAIAVYEITVPTGGPATIEVETFSDASTSACSGIDTVIRLYDDSGTQLGSDDDGGTSTCSRIDSSDSFATLQPGTYFLAVEEFGKNSAITFDITFDVP